MWRSSSTTVWPTAPKSRSACARCFAPACAPGASAVMPWRTSAGVLGIARTTGTPSLRCFSMTAVLTDDAAEIRSCEAVSRGPTSRRTGTTCCGLTVSRTTFAPSTASALDAEARTPSRRARSRERVAWSVVTTTAPGSVSPASRSPRMSVSPSWPAPSTARRSGAPGSGVVRVRAAGAAAFAVILTSLGGSAKAGARSTPASRQSLGGNLSRGRVRAPVVEAAARLPAVPARDHHALQERRGREARLLELVEHDLADVVRGVEADVVGEEQRPHRIAAAELHGVVDVVATGEPLLVDADRVEHVGHEQAIHHDPVGLAAIHHGLPERHAPGARLGYHGRVGAHGAHHLDELHERHRVEEVEPDEALGALAEVAHLGDRQARGVRREDRARLGEPLERTEQLFLERDVLRGGLDDQVAVGQVLELDRSGQVLLHLVELVGRDLAFVHAGLEELVDRGEALLERVRGNLAHDGREARLRADLRDAAAHQAAADHADFLDRHGVHASGRRWGRRLGLFRRCEARGRIGGAQWPDKPACPPSSEPAHPRRPRANAGAAPPVREVRVRRPARGIPRNPRAGLAEPTGARGDYRTTATRRARHPPPASSTTT